MHSYYLDAIRNFEGFTPKASWDYAQFSNGYGTRARFDGEVIDRAEAERRFKAEISEARQIVERAAPQVDEGTKAALTSLTYNAGTTWVRSGLGEAVRAGDLDTVREIFQKYNKAGGEVLPGLVRRRTAEAQWIGNPAAVQLAQGEASDRLGQLVAAATSAGGDRDQSAQRVTDLIQKRMARAMHSAGDQAGAGAETSRVDREMAGTTTAAALSRAASDALLALSEADRLTSERVADMARAAQLGRGSELAMPNKDGENEKTRRI
ncbi:muraminidase [Hyphomicrobium nitrativorans NL23]|uniref:Lysozyme n=1 Tax=Hyphomicrobium nitrativorans NL23 TaxID=1029756 RepID=V5SAJ6_9HYPH|nr:lysozyme [Hyphomicrobium nitrativorans]AHB47781.1 muraminidase [Hyphomicrobium nitrativorans NL23]